MRTRNFGHKDSWWASEHSRPYTFFTQFLFLVEMLKFIAARLTPPSQKFKPTTFLKKKTPIQTLNTNNSNTPVLPKPPTQRLRPLIAQKDSRKLIPRSFFIFNRPQFSNDYIHKALTAFCSCPSFQRLTPIIDSEIMAWKQFSEQNDHIFGRKIYLQRQLDQKSTAREPNSHCKEFLELSFTCRLLFLIAKSPPRYFRSDESPDFGLLFAKLRKLPHFARNLIHELITFCNLGTQHYIHARRAQKYLANTSWKTYQSALNQLAKHLDLSFDSMYHKLLQNPSPIEDSTIYNFLCNSVDSKRWLNNRSVAVLSGLKKITQVNGSNRFDTPFWNICMSEIKDSGLSKRKPIEGLTFEKNFSAEFCFHVWAQAKLRGTANEAAQIQFCAHTCQRPTDYDNFLPTDGTLDDIGKKFRAIWKWGKTRTPGAHLQYTFIPYGRDKSFYDIKTCWKTLLDNFPQENNTYLFNYKTVYGEHVTALKTVQKYALWVPIQFQSFPASEFSLYFFKNMMTDFLARTNDLHPQIGGHYLKHAISNPDFIKNTKTRFGRKAHMWFSDISLRYTLKVSHLKKIQTEFQRLWDEICFEQTLLLKQMWQKMGFKGNFDDILEGSKETKATNI